MTQQKNGQRSWVKKKVGSELAAIINLDSFRQESLERLFSTPPKKELGDLSLPCFPIAKAQGVSPKDYAEQLAEKVLEMSKEPESIVSDVKVAGPFLNLFIDKKKLSKLFLPLVESSSFFTSSDYKAKAAKERTMVEYGGPNTHKNFHVGHLRNICIGDSFTKMLRFTGTPVMPVNYIGDEGTHIAECLWYLDKFKPQEPEEDLDQKVIWLENAYAGAKKTISEAGDTDKETYKSEVGAIHRELESGKGPFFDRWQETKKWCMDSFYKTYEFLNADFEHYFYESEVSAESQKIVDEYLEKNVFVKDSGAIGIKLDEDKPELPFLLLRKGNGATLYATKDLALARQKFREFDIERSLYVVAAEQNMHFRQVFKTLDKMGFKQAAKCEHLSYAWVKIPGGKMSTRKGNAVHFSLVRDEMLAKVRQILKSQDKYTDTQQIDTIAEGVTVAALRYGMLATDPNKEIIFALDDWLSFEGNTGPYLLYSYARASAIMRKSQILPEGSTAELAKHVFDPPKDVHDSIGTLLMEMQGFHEQMQVALDNHRLSSFCSYLYGLCRAFNRMYAHVHINKEEDLKHKAYLVQVVACFRTTIKKGLELIGIQTLEEM